MAYDEELAGRVRKLLAGRKGITEKAMFGGLSFLLEGKMGCGVLKDTLVVRIDPKDAGSLLKKPHVEPMNFTGRPMKGFLYVHQGACKTEKQLSFWVEQSIAFVSKLPKKKA